MKKKLAALLMLAPTTALPIGLAIADDCSGTTSSGCRYNVMYESSLNETLTSTRCGGGSTSHNWSSGDNTDAMCDVLQDM